MKQAVGSHRQSITPTIAWNKQASGIEVDCITVREQRITIGVKRIQQNKSYIGIITSRDRGHSWQSIGGCIADTEWLSICHAGDGIRGIALNDQNDLQGHVWNGNEMAIMAAT